MTTDTHRETAKVYIFPARWRVKAGTFSGEANSVANPASLRLAANVSSGAWYHEEAIEEAAREKGN
jgi:hypothetical protein